MELKMTSGLVALISVFVCNITLCATEKSHDGLSLGSSIEEFPGNADRRDALHLQQRDASTRDLLSNIQGRLASLGDMKVNFTKADFGKRYSGYVHNNFVSTFQFKGTTNQVG